MKKLSVTMLAAIYLLVPQAALALIKVVNNSKEEQSVSYSHAGTTTTKTLQVGDVVFFQGNDGLLSIDVSKQTIKATNAEPGAVSGYLGDISANNRTSGIPASRGDVFMIWPDGRLIFQQRRRANGGAP